MKKFTLQIPKDIETALGTFGLSIRDSVRRRLQGIADQLSSRPQPAVVPALDSGPPLRFYVSEGCRVSYDVDLVRRKVVVVALKPETN